MSLKGPRFKNIAVPLFLLALALLVFVRHHQIENRGVLRWYDRTLVSLTAPVAEGLVFMGQGASGWFDRYFFLVGVQRENEDLKRQIAEYRTKEMLSQAVAMENERLLRLTELQKQMSGQWTAARIIAFPPIGSHRLVTIDKGSDEGIRERSPVIATDGLVGQVARVMGHYSQVLLITDPTSAVDGRMETGTRGLVVGRVMKLGLEREFYISAFEYLSRSVDIEDGALVVSSGLDGIYPSGVPIGRVRSHSRKKYDVFQQAEIIPAVDFNKLQEVLVLKRQ